MTNKSDVERCRQFGRRCAQRRAGLSVLEFIGCVMAVVGGAWLGAIYLGIDLRHVAHEALFEAELLDKVPENWRPAAPEEDPMTREQLVATLREELGGLRTEISALRTGRGEQGDKTAPADASATSPDGSAAALQESQEKTLAYWTRLNEIATGEAALQFDAESAFNDANAAKVFAIKGRISRFASKAVEAIPQESVEGSVVQFGQQLSVWYERAGDLYNKAVQIWESSSAGSQGRTQLNEEWGRAQLQHRNEARLLHEKASAVRSAVSRRFGQEFPEFVRPQAESAPSGETSGGTG